MLAGGGSLMLTAPAVRAQGQNAGVALVIGNSKYQWEAQLPNVRRDAPDIAKVFQAMGLKTELVQDAGHAAMRQALGPVKTILWNGPLGVFEIPSFGVATREMAKVAAEKVADGVHVAHAERQLNDAPTLASEEAELEEHEPCRARQTPLRALRQLVVELDPAHAPSLRSTSPGSASAALARSATT